MDKGVDDMEAVVDPVTCPELKLGPLALSDFQMSGVSLVTKYGYADDAELWPKLGIFCTATAGLCEVKPEVVEVVTEGFLVVEAPAFSGLGSEKLLWLIVNAPVELNVGLFCICCSRRCFSRCVFSLSCREKVLSQNVHENGRSPVCVRI